MKEFQLPMRTQTLLKTTRTMGSMKKLKFKKVSRTVMMSKKKKIIKVKIHQMIKLVNRIPKKLLINKTLMENTQITLEKMLKISHRLMLMTEMKVNLNLRVVQKVKRVLMKRLTKKQMSK
jgi:membrane carboxypeptidase/penicillin-binding protein PbpC